MGPHGRPGPARRGDVWTGAVLALAGAAIALRSRTFPAMAGMDYGPGLFPTIAALGLLACGLAIAWSGRRGAQAAEAAPPAEPPGRAGVARAVGVVAIVAFFGVALVPLGFHVTAALSLAALFAVFGLGPLRSLALALGASVAIHAVFYSLLRVPLPWGVLTPVAW